MTLRDESRKEFAISGTSGTHDEIRTGSLQRIADACEKMASNYLKLQEDLDLHKRWLELERDRKFQAWRKISALRGVITKMKKGKEKA